jgi:anti-sigma factor RsiW
MNPDKLFDYLDGKLPDWERTALERQIAEDPQTQKEFAAARRIHSSMRGDSREVLLQDDAAANARGRKMALRVGIAFLILMAVNVAAGLFFIARHEASNPNRKLLEGQMRDQLTKSLQAASHAALTPPALELAELEVKAAPGQLNNVADRVVSTAESMGGSATKELPDEHRIGVLVDMPANRESDFRSAIAALGGAQPASPSPSDSPANNSDKKSFIIHVLETPAP